MSEHEIDAEEIKFLRERETEFDAKVAELERRAFELELENTKLQGVIQTREKDVMKVFEQLQAARAEIADLQREAKGMGEDYRVLMQWGEGMRQTIETVTNEMQSYINEKTLVGKSLLERWQLMLDPTKKNGGES